MKFKVGDYAKVIEEHPSGAPLLLGSVVKIEKLRVEHNNIGNIYEVSVAPLEYELEKLLLYDASYSWWSVYDFQLEAI